MNKIFIVSVISIAIMFTGCSSSKESDGVWVNKEKIEGKKFTKLFVIVMTADIQARVRLEGDQVKAANARGIQAVKSLDLLPFDLNKPRLPTKDEIVEKIKSSGCDGVLVTSLIKHEEGIEHKTTQAGFTKSVYYSDNYYGFFSTIIPTVGAESYYNNDKTYFMQTNLYDVASTEIMWSVQSEVFNPTSIDRASIIYTNTILAKLEKQKVIKKLN